MFYSSLLMEIFVTEMVEVVVRDQDMYRCIGRDG